MAEPSSAAIATATVTGVTLLSYLTNIDAETLMGAASGASIFVISAKDHKLLTRFIYLIISLCMGYQAGPVLLENFFKTPSVCAFVFSACCINLAQQLIKASENASIFRWFKS
ncbi:putative phage holin [Alteromonadaceae bacterium 2753L.S.0a.02]|nr:putative phage holin [Alteromonadaceae bacterium 2753L.S.0a.02]